MAQSYSGVVTTANAKPMRPQRTTLAGKETSPLKDAFMSIFLFFEGGTQKSPTDCFRRAGLNPDGKFMTIQTRLAYEF